MSEGPRITWPSEACEKAFWERVKEAMAKGEKEVSLLGLPDMPPGYEIPSQDAFEGVRRGNPPADG